MSSDNLGEVTKEQVAQAVQDGHETLAALIVAFGLTRDRARYFRDVLVADEVIEPYAVMPSYTRGRRAYRYRLVAERRGGELSRHGHQVVREAIDSLRGHGGPFAVLLSTAEVAP